MARGKKEPNIDRFMALVDMSTGHWLWLGARDPKTGYPRFRDNEVRKLVRAHRWSYNYFIGPIPKDYDVHHKCEFKHCVYPWDLEAVSKKDHPDVPGNRTHCPKGHPYDMDNGYYDTYGRRRCRICRRITVMASYYRTYDSDKNRIKMLLRRTNLSNLMKA